MNRITALVLTATGYGRAWPGLEVVEHRSRIADARAFCCARFDAIAAVRTPFFFFLDDDDELPAEYPDVLKACFRTGAAVAYTDRLVDGQLQTLPDYSQAAHLRDPRLVHQLALFDTHAARDALQRLPRGAYYPEMLLAWEVAKRGAAHVPAVGYHWHRSAGALHLRPDVSIAQVRSKAWCARHC